MAQFTFKPNHKILASEFNSDRVYPCPVCRLGQIEAMPLMDAMACHFCNHIFTLNLDRQEIQLADRQPPLIWRWNGRAWTGAHLQGIDLNWGYKLAAVALVAFPTILIGLAAYIFPPSPGSSLSWFPFAWAVLALLSHLGIVLWLVIEFYQIPVGAYLRAIGQNMQRVVSKT